MRHTRWLLPLVVLLLAAACGGSGGASDGDGNGGNGGNGGESQAADTPEPAQSEGNGGNGGNGGGLGDLDQLVETLTPPNSTETTRTTVEGAVFIGWESSDSPESLEGFYESAIASTGLSIVQRTSAEGSYAWIFGSDSELSEGGVVTVAPGPDGTGSTVVVQVGMGN